MPSLNSEVLDAVELAFADEEFEALSGEHLDEINNPSNPEDKARLFGGSIRRATVYDPVSSCNVEAFELFGLGEAEPGSEQDVHVMLLGWDDDERTSCTIDLDSGAVYVRCSELDLTKNLAWKARILGALSMFADKNVGF